MSNRIYKRKILCVFLSFSGALLVLLNTWKFGNGITDDSVNYLYAGLNLSALNGFFNYNGANYTNWPPLYPLLIFMISFFSADIFLSITLLNSALFFTTIFLSGKIAELYLKGSFGKMLFPTILTFSYPMLFVFTRIWTEPLFILLSFFIILIEKKDNKRFDFILLVTFTLLVLTRYIGLAVITAYIVHRVINEFKSQNGQKNRIITKYFLFSVVSITPIILWFLRNVILKNEITTLSFNLPHNIILNIYRLIDSISILFIPESFNANIRLAFIFVFLTGSVILNKKYSVKIKGFGFIKSFMLFYSVFLIILSTIYKFEDISLRYVIPLYPFLLLYLISYFENYVYKFSANKYKFAFYIILISFSVFPMEKGIKHTAIHHNNGINDFSSRKWTESSTIKYINSNLRTSKIYSNSVAGIYANTMLVTSDVYEISKNNIHDRNYIIILFDNNLPGITNHNFPEVLFDKPDSVIEFHDSKIYIINK